MDQTISFPRVRLCPPRNPLRRNSPVSCFLGVTAEAHIESTPSPSLPVATLTTSSPPDEHSKVKQIHAHHLIRTSEECSLGSPIELICMYSECGNSRSAAMVFLMGVERGSLSWSDLIREFEGGGERSRQFLEIFSELHKERVSFSAGVLPSVLRISTELMDFWLGLAVHALAIKLGLCSNVRLKCALMDFYANCHGTESLGRLFDEMAIRNAIIWNKAIVIHIESGMWVEALELFREMQISNVKADEVTIGKVLQTCGRHKSLKEGKQIHGYVFRSGFSSDTLVNNSLISMYSKNSSMEMARKVFETMVSPNLVSWNSMITGYAVNCLLDKAWELFNEMGSYNVIPDQVSWNCLISGYSYHGCNDKVLEVFRKMQNEGLKTNSSTITSVLQTISETAMLELGKEIHGHSTREGLDCNIFVATSMVDMYVKCGRLTHAQRVFDLMKIRNTFAWNSLISGYALNGLFDEALELLRRMEEEGIEPDLTTWNGLIYAYSKKGLSEQALTLIRQLKTWGEKPNLVSWTSLISGCCQKGNCEDALQFFVEMQSEGIEPNAATLASLLRACAGLAWLKKGKEVHSLAMRKGFDKDIFVATALIDMYSKSGSLQKAHRVFVPIRNKNVVSWNVMIKGFSVHGLGKEAILLFDEMCKSGVEPIPITFTVLLSGCRHSGLISEAWRYFDIMRNTYNITPTLEHYACIVDLLGRGGYLDEAWDFIKAMPLEPDASVWGALLGASSIHKNLELGEIAAKHLFELEPQNSANYLLMSSLYAQKNRWEDVEDMRNAMKAMGLENRAGWSWIQIDQTIHAFSIEGKRHPDMGEIYFELYQMVLKMKKLGYVPDTSCVAQNVEVDEKEKMLMGHPEKLAITYGLIRGDKGVPVTVIKNSGVCNDCHSAAKYMSKISRRKIVLRDGTRFHHFEDGRCSCNDYW